MRTDCTRRILEGYETPLYLLFVTLFFTKQPSWYKRLRLRYWSKFHVYFMLPCFFTLSNRVDYKYIDRDIGQNFPFNCHSTRVKADSFEKSTIRSHLPYSCHSNESPPETFPWSFKERLWEFVWILKSVLEKIKWDFVIKLMTPILCWAHVFITVFIAIVVVVIIILILTTALFTQMTRCDRFDAHKRITENLRRILSDLILAGWMPTQKIVSSPSI